MQSHTRWAARNGIGIGLGAMLGVATLVGGCATNEDVLATRRDVGALRNEMATLNRANQASRDFTEERLRKLEAEMRGRVESSVKETEGSRVALNQRLEELTTETRFVQGKLEENASVLRGLQSRVDEVDQRVRQAGPRVEGADQQVKAVDQQVKLMDQQIRALDQQIRALDQQFRVMDQQVRAVGQRVQTMEQAQPGAGAPPPVPPPAVSPAPGSPAPLGQAPPAETPQPPAATPPVAQPAAPAQPAPPVATAPPAAVPAAPAPPRPQVVLPPEDLYKAALSDYTKGEYDLAISGFRSYLKNYPRTSLAANAQYWLAECYFSQKNYTQAIEEFDVVIRDHADSPKVPSALFKQGEAYLQVGDTKQATTVLCELIGKHGKTREARLARDKNLRCR